LVPAPLRDLGKQMLWTLALWKEVPNDLIRRIKIVDVNTTAFDVQQNHVRATCESHAKMIAQ
jgi:hypothetical protein